MASPSPAEADPHRTLLLELGTGAVEHNSNDSLVHHLSGTRDLLQRWGARPALCAAGLFHSIYGTEYFPEAVVAPERRVELQQALGEEAEDLVWLWCFGRRTSLPWRPEQPQQMDHRDGGEPFSLSVRHLEDLSTLWYADTLEQLPRRPDREVPTLPTLARYRDLVLPAAAEAFDATAAEWADYDPEAAP